MANPFMITAGTSTYEVVEDVEAHFDAVASGAVTDAVTGRTPQTAVVVTPMRDGAVGKYLDHGVWCVACDLERILPGYPGANETFDVELSAPGYRLFARYAAMAFNSDGDSFPSNAGISASGLIWPGSATHRSNHAASRSGFLAACVRSGPCLPPSPSIV